MAVQRGVDRGAIRQPRTAGRWLDGPRAQARWLRSPIRLVAGGNRLVPAGHRRRGQCNRRRYDQGIGGSLAERLRNRCGGRGRGDRERWRWWRWRWLRNRRSWWRDRRRGQGGWIGE